VVFAVRFFAVLVLLTGALIEFGILLLAAWQGSAATSSPPLAFREWMIVGVVCLTFGVAVWLLVRSLFRCADRIELRRMN
jgi:hypothetical protein